MVFAVLLDLVRFVRHVILMEVKEIALISYQVLTYMRIVQLLSVVLGIVMVLVSVQHIMIV